jgi:Cys-Gly metallodipeptidase DUG1
MFTRLSSVSADPAYRPQVFKMAEFLIHELQQLDAVVETRELGKHVWEGKEYDLPPVVLASVGQDPEKKTILVYGHYDVQPVSWNGVRAVNKKLIVKKIGTLE